MTKEGNVSYSASGVDYNLLDPVKRLAQLRALETSVNLEHHGMSELSASRGESAFVWDEGESYKAFVIEGLGTKNLVADAVRNYTNKSYYDSLAQDTVAMIVNDLIVVGADPMVVNAYFAVGDSTWFEDEERAEDLVRGFGNAVSLSGATWGGGETPTLKGIIDKNTIDLSGSAIGIIKPKERLTLGEKITAGDGIFIVESSGIHANGLTLARKIADSLPDGYRTKINDNDTFGESLLIPTHIYANFVRDLFEAGLDIHYMINITGHGWRKIMRANEDFTYIIDIIPTAQPVFNFIQEMSGNSDEEMYGNFNMGAGFAVILPQDQIELAKEIASKNKFDSMQAGVVEAGPKSVEILPKKLEFLGESLKVR